MDSYFSEDSCMFEKPENLTDTTTDDFEATCSPCLLTNAFAGIDYDLKVFTVEYH